MSDTPRVARSVDDLKVGQWVAWANTVGQWGTRSLDDDSRLLWSGQDFTRGVVILSDPPPEPVTIPGDVWDQLYEAIPPGMGEDELEKLYGDLGVAISVLVRAVKR